MRVAFGMTGSISQVSTHKENDDDESFQNEILDVPSPNISIRAMECAYTWALLKCEKKRECMSTEYVILRGFHFNPSLL